MIDAHQLKEFDLFDFDLVSCLKHLHLLLAQRDFCALYVELCAGSNERARLSQNELRVRRDLKRILKLCAILRLQLGKILLRDF